MKLVQGLNEIVSPFATGLPGISGLAQLQWLGLQNGSLAILLMFLTEK